MQRAPQWIRCSIAIICILASASATASVTTIFAAASLQPALNEMAGAGLLGSPAPQLVYAATSALAQQIEDGAPADLFIAADARWMDDVVRRNAIVPNTRVDLLGNALVLIAPADSTAHADLAHGAAPLLEILGAAGHLAIALPDSVPAGIYAKQSLTKLRLWTALKPRLAMSRDVRAALNLVVLRQAPLGIVYRSDAASEPRVRALATFPADSHEPIVYQMAVVTGRDNATTRTLLRALQTPQARRVFQRWGFTVRGH